MLNGHFFLWIKVKRMNIYIIAGIVAALILIIAAICLITWKTSKNRKKNLNKLPQITKHHNYALNNENASFNTRNDVKNEVNLEFCTRNKTSLEVPASHIGNDLMDNGIIDDATVAMDFTSRENAFLLDRLHKNQLIIMKPSILIGTDVNKADFIIRESRTVSRQHAVLYVKEHCYYITDNHSTNHTYVNEIILKPGEIRKLHSGDMIRVADVNLEFLIK